MYELEVKGETAVDELDLLRREVDDLWWVTTFSTFGELNTLLQSDIRKAREWVFLARARVDEYQNRPKREGNNG